MGQILSVLATLILLVSGTYGTEPVPYKDTLDLMLRVYLPGTGAQAITQGDEVVICLTNPEEDATVSGVNDLQDHIGSLAKELGKSFHVKKVIAHIQFASGNETIHYTFEVTLNLVGDSATADLSKTSKKSIS